MKKCFRHPDRDAVHASRVPCAPSGWLHLCAECAKPENAQAVFDAYQATHGKQIKVFKSPPNKGN